MRVLPIILISSMFGGIYAGTLPADFKFKAADDNKRSSFISQFKEYQGAKEQAAHPAQGQASLEHDSSQSIEAHDTIEGDKDVQVDFIERCKQLVAQMVAYFSFSK